MMDFANRIGQGCNLPQPRGHSGDCAFCEPQTVHQCSRQSFLSRTRAIVRVRALQGFRFALKRVILGGGGRARDDARRGARALTEMGDEVIQVHQWLECAWRFLKYNKALERVILWHTLLSIRLNSWTDLKNLGFPRSRLEQ